ncbi:MAG: hypothetical protein C0520_06040 [Sphingopyxis sp.]|nr:hypothetical protein [Sphingopyxis sp.]
MTVRKFGRGRWRAALPVAMVALGLAAPVAVPVAAQDASAPAPAPSSIFRLPPADDNRPTGVQGPSDNGLPPVAPGERRGQPTPAPQPAAPRVVETQPAPPPATPTPAPSSSPRTAAPRPAERTAPPGAVAASPTLPASSPPAPGDSPPFPAAPTEDAPAVGAAPVGAPAAQDAAVPAAPAAGGGGTPLWAWLLAGLAALGAGIWYWRRRPALAGDAPAEPAPPAKAETPRPVPRAATPPAPQPRPAPAPPIAPVRSPVPPVREASPLVTRPAPEQRALVTMALEIRAIRILADRVEVAFTLTLTNDGPLAATGLMVRIALNQGSAMPEPVLARFFDGAGGSVMRDDMVLQPGAGEQLSTEVALPRAAVEPLMIGGKPMLVPVIAFDTTYHWDGPGEAFGQNAASFLIGRAPPAGGGDKLAPLPLDRPTLTIDRPGARATAIRRTQ